MITLTDKEASLCRVKILSAALSKDYLRKATYGHPGADKCLIRLSVITSLIQEIQKYQVVDENDFYDWGILNLGEKKITLSDNNSLPLEAGNEKYFIKNDQINCLTETEYCKILNTIELFADGCSC
jgi:hypothetical protein